MNKILILVSSLCVASMVLMLLNGIQESNSNESDAFYLVLTWVAVGLQFVGFFAPALARIPNCLNTGGKFIHICFVVLTFFDMKFLPQVIVSKRRCPSDLWTWE